MASYDSKKLLAEIKALEKQYAHQLEKGPHWLGIAVLPGWLPIVSALLARIDRELTPFELRRVRWAQIKQKWGGLRMYYHLDGQLARLHMDLATPDALIHLVEGIDDPLTLKIDRFIQDAAEKASNTCEICGEPGEKVNNAGWIMVACPAHRQSALR